MDVLLRKGDIELPEIFSIPASKSISNRLLIIRALAGENFALHYLSDAQDTVLLQNLLTEITEHQKESLLALNAQDAGTTYRFLTAYLALIGGNFLLTGTSRMQQRPVSDLVQALQQLGANISYAGEKGYPPLRISTASLAYKEKIRINAGTSSQFISALLLIAPYVQGGMQLQLENEIVSEPYIHMTLALMQQYGITCKTEGRVIIVPEGKYTTQDYTVESDWSGVSYAYAWSILQKKKLAIPFLLENSLQGDAVIAQLMRDHFNVNTTYFPDRIKIDPAAFKLPEYFSYDFTDCPDLAPTLVCLCAVLGIEAEFSGVEHLAIKESDRMETLRVELEKVGILLRGQKEKEKEGLLQEKWYLYIGEKKQLDHAVFSSHRDHRIAMSLSFFANNYESVTIQEAECVKKSFPGYFELLTNASQK